jgi:hypothetical protein
MTRANSEQLKHTPWFAKAGAASSIVPISRFVGSNIFTLKGGGYGCLFSMTGIDEEALTNQELEHLHSGVRWMERDVSLRRVRSKSPRTKATTSSCGPA